MLLGGVQSPIPLQLTCKREYQHRGPGRTQVPVQKEPDNYDDHLQHMFHHSSPHTFFAFKLLTLFFRYYFHHLCLSRNYYKLISCKWSRLQTWEGLVLGANQLSLICTLPVLPLRLGIDCQEVKTVPSASAGHKNHVPISLASAIGRYQSNSHA